MIEFSIYYLMATTGTLSITAQYPTTITVTFTDTLPAVGISEHRRSIALVLAAASIATSDEYALN